MVDYQTAFEKPFTDIKKLLIGILFSIVPIINFFARGFILECSGIGKNRAKKMPEWKDFGSLFVKGLLYFIITMIYFIPAVVVFLIGAGAAIINLANSIPWQQVMNSSEQEAVTLIEPIIENAAPSFAAALPFIIISFILALIALYILPIAVLSYIEKGFGKAFALKSVFRKAFTGKYFIAWILMILVNLILTNLLKIVPIAGVPAAVFISGVIAYSLFGQVYMETESIKPKRK